MVCNWGTQTCVHACGLIKLSVSAAGGMEEMAVDEAADFRDLEEIYACLRPTEYE